MAELKSSRRRAILFALLVAAGIFGVLLVRFSPAWIEILAWTNVPDFYAVSVPVHRGHIVVAQVDNPAFEIHDRYHSILRWRILLPSLAHVLGLPGTVVLALAPLASWLVLGWLIVFLATRGLPKVPGGPPIPFSRGESILLATVFAASSWFFTSTQWLGYYDSAIVGALLVTAFSRRIWAVGVACALTPWIDERFFFGFPLAMLVRCVVAEREPSARDTRLWLIQIATMMRWPIAVLIACGLLRLGLLGARGSPTATGYFSGNGAISFLASPDTTWLTGLTRLGFGTWEGIRFGWIAIIAGLSALAWRGMSKTALLLAVVCLVVTTIGLATANDISRSMLLLVPLVPVAWSFAREMPRWQSYHIPLVLAVVAVACPASHVVTTFVMPIRPLWAELRRMDTAPATFAAYNLGSAYENGIDVEKNLAEAFRWYRLAAEKNYARAQFTLGLFYFHGRVVAVDKVLAADWYRRAAEQNYPPAQTNLGGLYLRGDGVQADAVQAVYWFRRAAANGEFESQYNLGLCYQEGWGVPRDEKEAVQYYRLAVRRNHAPAQFHLARAYERGTGVPVDLVQALAWYRKAAEQNFAAAQRCLGIAYAEGRGVAVDPSLAIVWTRRAAMQNDAEAQRALALMYFRGFGIAMDRAQAWGWNLLAEAAGLAASDSLRPVIEPSITSHEKQQGEEIARRRSAELFRGRP
jgi:TPR repeat protein